MGKYRTSCKDCIFAEWDKNKQTGCSLGRLKKFIQNTTTEFITSSDDSQKDHYLIHRFCNCCRNADWLELHKNENFEEAIYDEVKIKYDMIIPVDPNYFISLCLDHIVDIVSNFGERPNQYIIVYGPNSGLKNSELVQAMNKLSVNYRIVREFDDKNVRDMMNTGVNKSDAEYCVFVNETTSLFGSFSVSYMPFLEEWINIDLDKIIMIRNKSAEISGLCIQRMAYKTFGGNCKKGNIEDKITQAAQEQDNLEIIKTWD